MNAKLAGTPEYQTSSVVTDASVVERVTRTLDRATQLADLLSYDPSYVVTTLDYELPTDFKLSIVVPIYNERQTVHEIVARINTVPLPKEIILVDDCSTDGTRELLQPLEAAEGVTVVYKKQNEGKGAALRTGFAHATGDVVVVQDADLEYDPQDLVQLVKPILDNQADVVYGSRYLGASNSNSTGLHRFGNRVLTAVSNLFTGLHITDMETCYKAFRREDLRGLTIRQNRFGFEPEITAKIARRKLRVVELPISYDSRGYKEGKKIGIRDAFNAFYCIVRYALKD